MLNSARMVTVGLVHGVFAINSSALKRTVHDRVVRVNKKVTERRAGGALLCLGSGQHIVALHVKNTTHKTHT